MEAGRNFRFYSELEENEVKFSTYYEVLQNPPTKAHVMVIICLAYEEAIPDDIAEKIVGSAKKKAKYLRNCINIWNKQILSLKPKEREQSMDKIIKDFVMGMIESFGDKEKTSFKMRKHFFKRLKEELDLELLEIKEKTPTPLTLEEITAAAKEILGDKQDGARNKAITDFLTFYEEQIPEKARINHSADEIRGHARRWLVNYGFPYSHGPS